MPPLHADPLPWLLEAGQPSVRYWALRELCGCAEDDAELQAARAAIPQQALVQELFALQLPSGGWGDERKPYTATGALAALGLLHMHAVAPDARTAAGCDSLLCNCQSAGGGFSLAGTTRSGVFPCTTGQHLPMLVYFGFGEDPRVRRAFTFLIEDMAGAGALDCGRYAHYDCLWGAIAALNGLAALPAEMHTVQAQTVIQRLAETLLDAPYDFDGEHKRWLTFGVPRAWDLLSALQALAAHGYAGDPRFTVLLGRVLACQDAQGRFACGSTSRTWPLEKRGAPSRWITLDVMRVLKGKI